MYLNVDINVFKNNLLTLDTGLFRNIYFYDGYVLLLLKSQNVHDLDLLFLNPELFWIIAVLLEND